MIDYTASAPPPPPFDPNAREFNRIQVSMYDLYRASLEQGGGVVLKDRVFKDCLIEGPAVILVLPGTRFSHCQFDTGNDIRHILFTPVSPEKAIGALPLQNCVFEGCRFVAVGFTGHKNFIDLMIKELGSPQGQA